ncbi:MAG: hypothetical protein ACU0AT_09590 [Tranquillimonas sp.]
MRIIFTILAALFLALPAAAQDGRVIVTVGGTGGGLETPPEGAQALFNTFEIDPAGATGFDDAAMADLGMVEIDSNLPGQPDTSATYSGPLISDLLTAAGAEGKAALPMALDGYQVTIPWDDLMEYKPILATHVDGKPMAIGQIGPSMVIFPATGDAEKDKTFGNLRVWAVFYVGTE